MLRKTTELLKEWLDNAEKSSRHGARDEYNEAIAELKKIAIEFAEKERYYCTNKISPLSTIPPKHSQTFEKIQNRIHSEYNSNFYFNRLKTNTRVWILEMCYQIDREIAYIRNITEKMKENPNAER